MKLPLEVEARRYDPDEGGHGGGGKEDPKTLVVIFFRFVCFFSLVKAPTKQDRGITSI